MNQVPENDLDAEEEAEEAEERDPPSHGTPSTTRTNHYNSSDFFNFGPL